MIGMSLPDIIIEHAPLSIVSVEGIVATLLFAVYLITLVSTPAAWKSPTFWLPVVWFVLTITRIRHAPLFAITMAATCGRPRYPLRRCRSAAGGDE